MDRSNMSQYKALLRVIKYLLDTKYYSYQMKSGRNNRPWRKRGYSDTNYLGDIDTSENRGSINCSN